jgi:hypothetical protein
MRTSPCRLPLYFSVIMIATFAVGACGGNGHSSGPNVLVSIAIAPSGPTVTAGLTSQLHATGTYSNGSTSDLTSSLILSWSSAAQSIATVSSTGLVTSWASGTSVISAYSGSVIGTTTLTVTPAVVQSITVSPNPASSGVGVSLQMTAAGKYSDGTTANITSGLT